MNTFNDAEYDRVCDENEKLKAEIERLKQCNEQISRTHAEIINNLRAGAHSDAEIIDKLKRERAECRRLLREAVEARWSANGKLTLVRTEWFDDAAKAGGGA